MILIFIALAAICNAIMDVLQFHYENSIFCKTNDMPHSKRNQYWNPEISWLNKYIGGDDTKGLRKIWFMDYPAFLTDGWHLFKSLMILFICASVSLIVFDFKIWSFISNRYLAFLLLLLIAGTVWNFFFNMFYNFILVKKK